jgi:hypothetical protein
MPIDRSHAWDRFYHELQTTLMHISLWSNTLEAKEQLAETSMWHMRPFHPFC